jgi:hypothetical protein
VRPPAKGYQTRANALLRDAMLCDLRRAPLCPRPGQNIEYVITNSEAQVPNDRVHAYALRIGCIVIPLALSAAEGFASLFCFPISLANKTRIW